MSHRIGYPHVNSSLIEESAMGNISIISVASPLFCHLVTSRAAMAGRRSAHL